MKIIALQAENIKKLVAVEIRPDGNLVQITGKNGAGKTSILDAIWWALAGAGNIQGTPIRKGAESARIRLDLGEIVVTRTFKPGKDGGATSGLMVENAEGARFPSPQSMLDSLLGSLSFDPLAFARMEPRRQFEALRAFVPGVDFDAIDQMNKLDYSARTDANRKAKDARAAAAKISVPQDLPAAAVDESALVDDLEKAGKHNADIESRKRNREIAAGKIESLLEEANTLRLRADAIEKEAAEISEKLKAAPPLSDPIDTSEIRQSIQAAKEINAAIRQREQRQAYEAAAEEAEKKSKELTAKMDSREAEKRAAIYAAKLPVEGLGFGEGEILLNGIPFAQASDAEQLKVSIAIAMALNPKLRVIRVRDGSLLDEESMALLGQMVNGNDFQCWVERVDGSGKVGFVLEDGHLKETKEANQ